MLMAKRQQTVNRSLPLFFGRGSLFLDGASSQLLHIGFDREALGGGLVAELIGDRDGNGHAVRIARDRRT